MITTSCLTPPPKFGRHEQFPRYEVYVWEPVSAYPDWSVFGVKGRCVASCTSIEACEAAKRLMQVAIN